MTSGTTGQSAPGTASDAATWNRDDWLALADRMLAADPAVRVARPRPRHPSRPGGRLRAGRRRPGGFRPHLPPGRFPHRRRPGSGRGRAGGPVRDRHRRRHRPERSRPLGTPGRAPPGQGGGRLHRAGPGPDPPVDLGPAAVRGAGAGGRLPAPGGRRRHVPTDQLGLVPAGRPDVPALGGRAALARRDGRGPAHARRLRPRGRLDVRRAGARLRPLCGLGSAPVPDAVGPDGRRRGPGRAAPRSGPGQPRPLSA